MDTEATELLLGWCKDCHDHLNLKKLSLANTQIQFMDTFPIKILGFLEFLDISESHVDNLHTILSEKTKLKVKSCRVWVVYRFCTKIY